jgi:hypothetical protein
MEDIMTRRTSLATRLLVVGSCLALLLAASGCSKKSSNPVAPPPPPSPPSPSTPAGALQLLKWAYEHRDTSLYRSLFTTDYGFTFVARDTANRAWTYLDERASARHLLVGGGSPSPATTVSLKFSGALSAQAIPSLNPTYRMQISAPLNLTISLQDTTSINTIGNANFYFVRGDSALVPADLAGQGVTGTSSRWFLYRWDDGTGGVSPYLAARVRPAQPAGTHNETWGDFKVRYRSP